MKVALAGASQMALTREVAHHALQTLAALPPGTTVLLRRGRETPPGDFEMLVHELCKSLSIPVEWRVPEPGGRSQVYLRDVEMVQAADSVICYFHHDRVMTGGTGHVAEKALDQEKPLYAYAQMDDTVTWVGGDDGHHN